MSEELIRRSDAIKAMEQRYQDILRIFKRKVKVGEKAIALDMIGCIKSLPSVDIPQGEWYQIKDHKVMGEGYLWHCSLCDHRVYQDSSADYPTENFCPNCGCAMTKE